MDPIFEKEKSSRNDGIMAVATLIATAQYVNTQSGEDDGKKALAEIGPAIAKLFNIRECVVNCSGSLLAADGLSRLFIQPTKDTETSPLSKKETIPPSVLSLASSYILDQGFISPKEAAVFIASSVWRSILIQDFSTALQTKTLASLGFLKYSRHVKMVLDTKVLKEAFSVLSNESELAKVLEAALENKDSSTEIVPSEGIVNDAGFLSQVASWISAPAGSSPSVFLPPEEINLMVAKKIDAIGAIDLFRKLSTRDSFKTMLPIKRPPEDAAFTAIFAFTIMAMVNGSIPSSVVLPRVQSVILSYENMTNIKNGKSLVVPMFKAKLKALTILYDVLNRLPRENSKPSLFVSKFFSFCAIS